MAGLSADEAKIMAALESQIAEYGSLRAFATANPWLLDEFNQRYPVRRARRKPRSRRTTGVVVSNLPAVITNHSAVPFVRARFHAQHCACRGIMSYHEPPERQPATVALYRFFALREPTDEAATYEASAKYDPDSKHGWGEL